MGPPIGPPAAEGKRLRWVPNEMRAPVTAPVAVVGRYVGEIVAGRYQLVRPLRDGSRETWEARHLELGRAVVIEFLAYDERVLDEARALAHIRHPNVVDVLDFGRSASGQPFLVTEQIAGETLAERLRQWGAIPWARAVTLVQQIVAALGAAHQQGIVHRDLQPANVFVLEVADHGGAGQEFVKLVDFGLARATTVVGTPSYASPEQCRGEPLDPRSDVYVVGCLLYTMVTGEPPFAGAPEWVVHQQQHDTPRPLRERTARQFIPDELEALVARCLAKRPDQRFADTRELAAGLARLAQFAAANVGAPLQAAGASAQPMGFAGQPAPRSRTDLNQRTKPLEPPPRVVATRPVAAPSKPRDSAMSPPAIVAATLAGVVAVLGFGLGMYWLVERMIQPESSPAGEVVDASTPTPPVEASVVPPRPSAGGGSPAAEPRLAGSSAGSTDPAPTGTTAGSQPESTTASASKTTSKPASKPASKAAEPSVEPTPAPAPADTTPAAPKPAPAKPTPKPSKPTTAPDSKAKDQIGHDELLDPWG